MFYDMRSTYFKDIARAQQGIWTTVPLESPGIRSGSTVVSKQEIERQDYIDRAAKEIIKKDPKDFTEEDIQILNASNLKDKNKYIDKYRIKKADAAKKEGWSSAKKFAESTSAVGPRLSLQRLPVVGDYIPDVLDVTRQVGDMASGLGAVPYNVQQGNYGQAALDIGIPLATGALAGMGTETTGQFINNLVNPFAGVDMNMSRSPIKPGGVNSGGQHLKDWISHPRFADRYIQINPGKASAPSTLQDVYNFQKERLALLNAYEPKNYYDLFLERPGVFVQYAPGSVGLSGGTPNSIYVAESFLGRPYSPKDIESTRVHELSHLVDENGMAFTIPDKIALTEPMVDINHSKKRTFWEKLFGEPDLTPYYTNPSEIKARMSQIRDRFNLTPDDTFTEEMYDLVKNENNIYGMAPYIRDKKGFIDLMNRFWAAPPTAVALSSVIGNDKENNQSNKQLNGKLNMKSTYFRDIAKAQNNLWTTVPLENATGINSTVGGSTGTPSIREINDSLPVQTAKLWDPTGISSWPDVAYAGKDFYQDPSWANAGNLAIAGASAIPIAGVLGKGVKIARAADEAVQAARVAKAIRAGKALENVVKYGGYGKTLNSKLASKALGGAVNYYNNNNNNNMRTSYFRDIAESMAKDGTLDRMANGSYARPRTYGNTYYSDMAQYFQDSGSPSMEVARRPSQQEFLEMIYDTLPPAWRQMSPQQAWNTFQQLPVPDQNVFARNAGIQWTDIPTMGMGTEGGDRRPGAVSEPQMIREEGLPTSIYQTLQRLRDLPVKADGTFVTEEEFYAMPIEDQKNWVDQAAARSQERVKNFDNENVVYERRTPTTSGYNLGAPGMEQVIPPSETPPSPARKKPGKGTGKRKGGSRPRTGTSTQGTKTVTPSTEERRRGISTKELYGTPPKRVLGGPNTIMDFFGNARGGMQYPPRMQDGQLMYYNDIDKAGLGDFFKGVGRTLHDFGRAQIDTMGNTLGLWDLSNEKYKTKLGKKYSGKLDKWNRAIGGIGRTALDFVIPGAGTGLSMLGSAVNPQGLGAKQQQRDTARQQMALGASGMAGPNWASNMGNAMSQAGQYNPSGVENAMSAMMPGLSALLPSLLGGPSSPGGFMGGPAGQGQGVFRQGGMPVGLMRHMEFMQLFEEPNNSRGTGPYLVY